MEITPSMIYWISRLDGLREGLLIIGTLGFIICTIITMYGVFEHNIFFKNAMICGIFCILLMFGVQIFVPRTREAVAIIVIPKIANNEKIQDIGNDIYKIGIEWLNELKSNKRK